MRRLVVFLVLVLLLALPVMAVGQTPPNPEVPVLTLGSTAVPVATPAAGTAPALSADPIGYLEFYWPKILVILGTLFGIARVIVAYAPTPAPDAKGLWPMLYALITHASLPTPQAATPAGRVSGGVPPPAAEPPPATK